MDLCFTCGDAVEGLRHQIVDLLVQLRGGAFAVNLVHGGVGAVDPLHQPLQLAVTDELIPSQVPEENGRTSQSMRAEWQECLVISDTHQLNGLKNAAHTQAVS